MDQHQQYQTCDQRESARQKALATWGLGSFGMGEKRRLGKRLGRTASALSELVLPAVVYVRVDGGGGVRRVGSE